MRNAKFETCPLRGELDTALVEELLRVVDNTISIQRENPETPKEEIDDMTTDAERRIWKDHLLVERRMAEICSGVQATGECCLVELCRDGIEQRFNQSTTESPSEQ